jgi:hypothetical protein
MSPCIYIVRHPYEEPHHLHLELHFSNGERYWKTDLFDNADSLTKLANHLEEFPRHKDDVFLWQLGSEYQEDRWGYYFRFRVFVYDYAGHSAIQIRFNNNKKLPDREIVEFCMKADPAQINRLGKLFRDFSELKHEILLWGGHFDGLYVSQEDLIKNFNENSSETKVDMQNNNDDVFSQFNVARMRIREFEQKALKRLKVKKAKEHGLICSFCGTSVIDVERLIASEINKVFICNECIKNCGDLLNE